MGTTKAKSSSENVSASQLPLAVDSTSNGHGISAVSIGDGCNPKPKKTRAAIACIACRTRKVRCDVVYRYHMTGNGEATCSNCAMDDMSCVTEKSKRQKKHLDIVKKKKSVPEECQGVNREAQVQRRSPLYPIRLVNQEAKPLNGPASMSNSEDNIINSQYWPRSIDYKPNLKSTHQINETKILGLESCQGLFDPDIYTFLTIPSPQNDTALSPLPLTRAPILKHDLPGYIKPLSQRTASVDMDYLFENGALVLPDVPLRNALLQSYVEYVHPYMPLLELHEFLHIINEGTGKSGRISVLVFQAVMFSSTTFVNMDYLVSAGYTSRRAARKAFFEKVRMLYDFDCEVDYIPLLQCLLLMTYWHETLSHEKDTWHWMGIATSLVYAKGLHKNPDNHDLSHSKKKLRRRIWWACFIRDHLVALGTRQPTRIKDQDYDVPMLTEDDFELAAIPESMTIISPDCSLARDVEAQRELAQMCIAKAKLCLCISHVLSTQYFLLFRPQYMQGKEPKTNYSSMMLFPKKMTLNDEVKHCDDELRNWIDDLPRSCTYCKDIGPGSTGASLFVHKSLLHMLYFTTLSTLHRPQGLLYNVATQSDHFRALQDLSKEKVRSASSGITRITRDIHTLGLARYLPLTAVTVLLPAMIFHLLDIKYCHNDARQAAASDGFHQCMHVLRMLRGNYPSADLATKFLEAAIQRVDIDIRYSNLRESTYHTEFQAKLSGNEVMGLTGSARAGRKTQPSTNEAFDFRPGDSMDECWRFLDQIDSDTSTRTPPNNELLFSGNPRELTSEVDENTTTGNINILNDNIGLINCWNPDQTYTEFWNDSLGVHCDGSRFMDDMNWIGQVWEGLVEQS